MCSEPEGDDGLERMFRPFFVQQGTNGPDGRNNQWTKSLFCENWSHRDFVTSPTQGPRELSRSATSLAS
jgi:hypothetical protein